MKKCVIAISHSNYLIKPTGTEKCIRELAEVLRGAEIETIQIFAINNRFSKMKTSQIVGVNYGEEFVGIFALENVYAAIADICIKNSLEPIAIHLHHLANFILPELKRFIEKFTLPLVLFVHDYYTICTSINMINSDGIFCGVSRPHKKKCNDCSYYKNKVASDNVYHFVNDLSSLIAKVVAPSEDLRKRWLTVYNNFKGITIIREHLESKGYYKRNRIDNRPFKIAFVGAQLSLKGFFEWEQFLGQLRKLGITYEFHYFGKPLHETTGVINHTVSIIKDGNDAMTKQLRESEVDVVFLWSMWPETYSYVYYEASAAGACIVTNPYSGNVAAMIKKNGNGIIFKNVDEVISYFKDVEFARSEITQLLGNNNFSPQLLEPNPEVADLLSGVVNKSLLVENEVIPKALFFPSLLYRLKHKIKS